jgi:hypothetical protein
MVFTLEVLEAAEGDCLLLWWGNPDHPHIAVIDGGPGRIYEDSLRPRLEKIREAAGVDTLDLDLVVVSHVDNDHVMGIKKLFRDLQDEVESNVAQAQRPFSVRRLWHNTFNDILGDAVDAYYQQLTASCHAAVGGAPNPALVAQIASAMDSRYGAAPDAGSDAFAVVSVLAGHGEARQVRSSFEVLYHNHLIAALNAPFTSGQGKGRLITAKTSAALDDGLKVTAIGPLQDEIDALQADFDDYIEQHDLTAAYADKSIPNLSSIIFLVELGQKKILLTGDARGDRIIEGLKSAGMLADGVLNVDVLKVPHHGSSRNLAEDFFETIVADTYVFSANGKYGNPDLDTLEWLTQARGQDAKYEIVLTYPLADIDRARKADAQKHNKAWASTKDALKAFFDKKKDAGFNFTLTVGAPAKIELADKVNW